MYIIEWEITTLILFGIIMGCIGYLSYWMFNIKGKVVVDNEA